MSHFVTTHHDPIVAVTSDEPGRIYAGIALQDALVWSDSIGMWVAANTSTVRDVLTHANCRVRPAGEPIPPCLTGTTAGAIFSKLARMTDGGYHDRAKRAISHALDSVEPGQLRSGASHRATALANDGDLSRFSFELPIHVVGELLGAPDAQLRSLTEWTGSFVRCLVPRATEEDVLVGIVAANQLSELFSELLSGGNTPRFLATMRNGFQNAGVHDLEAVIANTIGILFQTHDATAGLIGNTIIHLARHPDAIDSAIPLDSQVRAIIADVSHNDASIQNTRRFVTRDATISGQAVQAGDAILIVLASTQENDSDAQGDAWPFGFGNHACPGQSIALTIAEAAVVEIVRRGMIPVTLPSPMPYRHLANARVPIFGCPVQH